MKFKYVGSGDTPPKETMFNGYHFVRGGDAVYVKEDDLQKKLSRNPSFEVVGKSDKPKAEGDRGASSEPSYHEMLTYLKEMGVKPSSRSKADVTEAWKALAEAA